jgi:hypothetical protein
MDNRVVSRSFFIILKNRIKRDFSSDLVKPLPSEHSACAEIMLETVHCLCLTFVNSNAKSACCSVQEVVSKECSD